jgi:Holliday junction resolvasome RuvABC endonuclease subunit
VNILALDLATHTGWCLRENGRLDHGVEDFSLRRGESDGMRWLKFRRWLDYIAGERFTPDLIVFERWIASRTGNASEITAGFTTRISEFCTERHIEKAPVAPSELKKWTTGKGNAGKPLMVAAVCRRWNVRIDDDNEADAYALLQYALAELVPANA